MALVLFGTVMTSAYVATLEVSREGLQIAKREQGRRGGGRAEYGGGIERDQRFLRENRRWHGKMYFL